MNNVLMLQQKEIKCPAGMYRGLKDTWIVTLYSSGIPYPVSNTVPQETWSAVTQVKSTQKRGRERSEI